MDVFFTAALTAQNSPELNIHFIDSFYPMICDTISGVVANTTNLDLLCIAKIWKHRKAREGKANVDTL